MVVLWTCEMEVKLTQLNIGPKILCRMVIGLWGGIYHVRPLITYFYWLHDWWVIFHHFFSVTTWLLLLISILLVCSCNHNVTSNTLPNVTACPLSSKMTTSEFVKTLENLQHSMWRIPKSQHHPKWELFYSLMLLLFDGFAVELEATGRALFDHIQSNPGFSPPVQKSFPWSAEVACRKATMSWFSSTVSNSASLEPSALHIEADDFQFSSLSLKW